MDNPLIYSIIAEQINATMQDIAECRCLYCKSDVQRYRQVEQCVYAVPCGHRQYHGNIPDISDDQQVTFSEGI